MTLAELHIGSKLLLRCKTDWRDATVVAIREERVTLLVCSPTGYSYKVRKDADEELDFHGDIPLLGEGDWKEEIARYDVRW
jgi:hypothetical protein